MICQPSPDCKYGICEFVPGRQFKGGKDLLAYRPAIAASLLPGFLPSYSPLAFRWKNGKDSDYKLAAFLYTPFSLWRIAGLLPGWAAAVFTRGKCKLMHLLAPLAMWFGKLTCEAKQFAYAALAHVSRNGRAIAKEAVKHGTLRLFPVPSKPQRPLVKTAAAQEEFAPLIESDRPERLWQLGACGVLYRGLRIGRPPPLAGGRGLAASAQPGCAPASSPGLA